jgi:hypothetical protein
MFAIALCACGRDSNGSIFATREWLLAQNERLARAINGLFRMIYQYSIVLASSLLTEDGQVRLGLCPFI